MLRFSEGSNTCRHGSSASVGAVVVCEDDLLCGKRRTERHTSIWEFAKGVFRGFASTAARHNHYGWSYKSMKKSAAVSVHDCLRYINNLLFGTNSGPFPFDFPLHSQLRLCSACWMLLSWACISTRLIRMEQWLITRWEHHCPALSTSSADRRA